MNQSGGLRFRPDLLGEGDTTGEGGTGVLSVLQGDFCGVVMVGVLSCDLSIVPESLDDSSISGITGGAGRLAEISWRRLRVNN